MAGLEKWLKRLLLAALFNTCIWLSGMGCLLQAALIVSIIGVPLALFLTASPTILLYMLIGLPLWLLVRRRGLEAAIAAAAVPMLAVAVLVPLWANRRIDAQAAALVGRDHGGPLRLPTGKAVAWLEPQDRPGAAECGEICQRLLFSGTARMVLVGEPGALSGAAPLTAWYIGPRRGPCRPPALPAVLATPEDLGMEHIGVRRPSLSSRLAAVYGDGQCLFAEPRGIGTADIVLVSERFAGASLTDPNAAFDLQLVRVDRFGRIRILIRRNGRLVELVRRSRGVAYRLTGLLALTPPSGDDSGSRPGHWSWDTRELGDRKRYWIGQFVLNPLWVGGLVDERGRTYRPEAAARLGSGAEAGAGSRHY